MNAQELSRLAFFDGLCLADLELLGPYFTPQVITAGTTIFEQGDAAEYLYLVAKGEVVIQYKPEDGPMMTVTCVHAGGVFGWSAAMGNLKYTSGALSVTDCEVFGIRGKQLRKLCDQFPQVGRVILDHLAAVVAERQRHRQGLVSTILANGIRHQVTNPGEYKHGKG